MEFTRPQLMPDEYKRLVIETFGGYLPHVQHNIIVCKEGVKTVAVFNYFRYGVNTMYLHRCWFAHEYQQKIMKLKYWIGFCEYVKEHDYKYIMGVIDSQNKPALIWALKTGFEITGARQDISKNLIVEIIKEL